MCTLSLDLDALAVVSFDRRNEAGLRGTVHANEAVADTGVYSCAITCRCPSHHATGCC